MKSEQYRQWTTIDEILFLKSLGGWKSPGSHGPRGSGGEPRRRELLMRYKASMKGRVRWEAIDPKKIARYLNKVLKEKGGD